MFAAIVAPTPRIGLPSSGWSLVAGGGRRGRGWRGGWRWLGAGAATVVVGAPSPSGAARSSRVGAEAWAWSAGFVDR